MEFQLSTDLQTAMPQEIGFNYDELKAELAERLEYYKGVVVTEDTIKEGKADKATLRKLREAIETRRKDIKKQCMQPYTAFEGKVKELVEMIDEPIAIIDRQLSEFEKKRQDEKRAQVEDAYKLIFDSFLAPLFPLEKIMNPKWLNASTTMKSVQEDLQTVRKRIDADMLAMQTIPHEYQTVAESTYYDTLDIGRVFETVKTLQRNAEARRQADEARGQVNTQTKEEKRAEAKSEPNPATNELGKKYLLRLEFNITRAEAVALKSFLNFHGIEYKRV